jgi:SEC-C motif-containing protein
MRSRYSAFVREDATWLLATWHASTRPAQLDFESGARWLGLEVRRHRLIDADHAEVEFVARYRVAGRAVRLHESSRFVREEGHWFYVDGEQPG